MGSVVLGASRPAIHRARACFAEISEPSSRRLALIRVDKQLLNVTIVSILLLGFRIVR
jgi:hypothetical protein